MGYKTLPARASEGVAKPCRNERRRGPATPCGTLCFRLWAVSEGPEDKLCVQRLWKIEASG
eukprot:363570-Chlamydomonas_euryale.AAC.18